MILDDDQLAIRDSARRFAAGELAPHADRWDSEGQCPDEALQGIATLGFFGLLVPEAFGGAHAGHVNNAIVMEEIAAGCGGVSTILHVHNFGGCLPLIESGSPAQQQRFLPAMATGNCIGAFCLTEPDAGSDTSMIRTRATRVDGGWRLDGTKIFISNGARAGVAIVMAVTNPAAGKRGMTSFVVPTDTPGFIVGRLESKMGQRCADTVEIRLEDCRVPDELVLGSVDEGYAQTMTALSAGRVSIGAQAVGMARAAYESALAYARARRAYGKPIVEHQAIAFRLADMLTRIETARLSVLHAALRLDRGLTATREAAMAKCWAAEMAESVSSDAISILGGYGYVTGYGVERIYRDVRVCQIYEGTGDMQRLIISRHLDDL